MVFSTLHLLFVNGGINKLDKRLERAFRTSKLFLVQFDRSLVFWARPKTSIRTITNEICGGKLAIGAVFYSFIFFKFRLMLGAEGLPF